MYIFKDNYQKPWCQKKFVRPQQMWIFYKGVKEQGDHSHWNALNCTKNTWILNAFVEENLYQPPKIVKGKRCVHAFLDSLKKDLYSF